LDGFENRGLARAKQASWRTKAMLVRSEFVLLFIYLIVTADIEKNNLLFRHLKRQADAVTVGNAHRVQALHFSFKGVQPEMRLKRIVFEIAQDPREVLAEIGMCLRKFLGRTREPGGPD
jgi:hypothetical protein